MLLVLLVVMGGVWSLRQSCPPPTPPPGFRKNYGHFQAIFFTVFFTVFYGFLRFFTATPRNFTVFYGHVCVAISIPLWPKFCVWWHFWVVLDNKSPIHLKNKGKQVVFGHFSCNLFLQKIWKFSSAKFNSSLLGHIILYHDRSWHAMFLFLILYFFGLYFQILF